jgi:hypothetical protein
MAVAVPLSRRLARQPQYALSEPSKILSRRPLILVPYKLSLTACVFPNLCKKKSPNHHNVMSSSLPQTRIESDAVFDKAVAKFKKRLPKSQAATFVQCTIDDVRKQIRDIQNHHGSKRRLRNMERLSKFVEGMLQLGKVVEVFLNLHNGVALIWVREYPISSERKFYTLTI